MMRGRGSARSRGVVCEFEPSESGGYLGTKESSAQREAYPSRLWWPLMVPGRPLVVKFIPSAIHSAWDKPWVAPGVQKNKP